jgi:predicted subunit of tRNA(5-methylaminomethyl-2-thiouridylate) methyltransferase
MLSKERINKAHDKIHALREEISIGRSIIQKAFDLGVPDEATAPAIAHVKELISESAQLRRFLRQNAGM